MKNESIPYIIDCMLCLLDLGIYLDFFFRFFMLKVTKEWIAGFEYPCAQARFIDSL